MKAPVNWAAKRAKAGGKLASQGIKTFSEPSVKNIALLAYRGVKGLRALVNSEEFVFDTGYNNTTVANTAIFTQLNNIAQGDGQSARTGNSILMKRLHRTEFTILTGSANAVVREILFLDKQQIADTTPTVTDILESASPYALLNKLTKYRFQILEDNFYTLSTAARPTRTMRSSKYLHKHAKYNGTASTDIEKNGLYKMIISDVAVGIGGSYRLYYHDN